MKLPTKEIFKRMDNECYEVSNYLRVRTVPYKLFKGKELVECLSHLLPTTVTESGYVQAIMKQGTMGLVPCSVTNIAKTLFGKEEIDKNIDFLNSYTNRH
ncbi:hypothetical protein N9562_00435 [Flavobacteriaceae bacterium]|nr:hypothetical protein [Flavobacteriaceae bacterium]